jgi:hypothetical protein
VTVSPFLGKVGWGGFALWGSIGLVVGSRGGLGCWSLVVVVSGA